MTDVPSAATPIPSQPGLIRLLWQFMASDNLLARATVLGLLTLGLLIPLNMIGGVIADRRAYEIEATKSVTENCRSTAGSSRSSAVAACSR